MLVLLALADVVVNGTWYKTFGLEQAIGALTADGVTALIMVDVVLHSRSAAIVKANSLAALADVVRSDVLARFAWQSVLVVVSKSEARLQKCPGMR